MKSHYDGDFFLRFLPQQINKLQMTIQYAGKFHV